MLIFNTREKYIIETAWSKMIITDYPDYTDFENYVKNNFVIDFAGTAWKVSKYEVQNSLKS